jgi:hypothetical protein
MQLNRRLPNGMTLTQGAFMLLTLVEARQAFAKQLC